MQVHAMNVQPAAPASPSDFSPIIRFDGIDWQIVPNEPGVYIIYDDDNVLYVGMAGRDGRGSLKEAVGRLTRPAKWSTCSRSTCFLPGFSSGLRNELRIDGPQRPRVVLTSWSDAHFVIKP